MKSYLLIAFLGIFTFSLSAQNEQMDVEGAIKIKAAASTDDGTIQYGIHSGVLDFWGRKSGSWESLTSGGSGGSSQWNLTLGILSPLSTGTEVGIGRTTMPTGSGLKFAVEGPLQNGWGGMSVNVPATSGGLFSSSKPYYGYNVDDNLRAYHYWDESSSEWRLLLSGSDRIKIKNNGIVTIPNLSGSGNRMVIADANGELSTQAISSGGGDDLGNHTATMAINASSNKITNLATPTSTGDAANKAYVDAHTDGDASSTNELQTLSLSSNTLSISSGNSVDLSGLGGSGGGDNDWIFQSGSSASDNIYRSGNVGIGSTTSPANPLHVVGSTSQTKTAVFTNSNTNGTAIEAQANANDFDVTAIKGIANGVKSLAGKFEGRTQTTKSINIGNFPSSGLTASAGEMRWNGTDFQGHDGSGWQSLTQSGCEIGTAITSLPYTISTSGFYYLEEDLTYTGTGNAITISATNVTIDFLGHSITGTSVNSSYGIRSSSVFDRIVIQNGLIKDLGRGMRFSSSGSNSLEVKNFVVDNSVESGFEVFSSLKVAVFYNCTSIDSGKRGFEVSGAESTTFDNCMSIGSTSFGFIANSATYNSCKAIDNGASGIDAGEGSMLINCVVAGNAAWGISLDENNVVIGCQVYDNDGAGIACFTGDINNTFINNYVKNNTGHGFQFSSNLQFMRGNTTLGNNSGPVNNMPAAARLIDNFFF